MGGKKKMSPEVHTIIRHMKRFKEISLGREGYQLISMPYSGNWEGLVKKKMKQIAIIKKAKCMWKLSFLKFEHLF